jgi:hypothetical protein
VHTFFCGQSIAASMLLPFLSLPDAFDAADFACTVCYPAVLFAAAAWARSLWAWATWHQEGRRGGSSKDSGLAQRQGRNLKTKGGVEKAVMVVPVPQSRVLQPAHGAPAAGQECCVLVCGCGGLWHHHHHHHHHVTH